MRTSAGRPSASGSSRQSRSRWWPVSQTTSAAPGGPRATPRGPNSVSARGVSGSGEPGETARSPIKQNGPFGSRNDTPDDDSSAEPPARARGWRSETLVTVIGVPVGSTAKKNLDAVADQDRKSVGRQ